MGTLNRHRLATAAACLALIPLALNAPALVALAAVALVCTGLIAYEAVRFREARDRVRQAAYVDLRQLTSEEQASEIVGGAIDVGLIREVDPRPGLRLETLLDEPVDAVVPATHPLAGRADIDLAELADAPLLWGRSGSPAFFDHLTAACRAAGFSPRIAHEMRGSQARQGLVAAGLGVSLEAASYADFRHRDVRFVPLTGQPVTARIQLAWTETRPDPRRDVVIGVARNLSRSVG